MREFRGAPQCMRQLSCRDIHLLGRHGPIYCSPCFRASSLQVLSLSCVHRKGRAEEECAMRRCRSRGSTSPAALWWRTASAACSSSRSPGSSPALSWQPWRLTLQLTPPRRLHSSGTSMYDALVAAPLLATPQGPCECHLRSKACCAVFP